METNTYRLFIASTESDSLQGLKYEGQKAKCIELAAINEGSSYVLRKFSDNTRWAARFFILIKDMSFIEYDKGKRNSRVITEKTKKMSEWVDKNIKIQTDILKTTVGDWEPVPKVKK